MIVTLFSRAATFAQEKNVGCFHPENLKPRAVQKPAGQVMAAQDGHTLLRSFVRTMELMAHDAERLGHDHLSTVVKEMTCLLLVMDASQNFDKTAAQRPPLLPAHNEHNQSILQIDALTIDLARQKVNISGQQIHLTDKEYTLLEALAVQHGSVLSKEELLGHLYGGHDKPDAKIIDVFICKLRRKLTQANLPDLISTVWGRGYAMRAAIITPQAVAVRAPRPLQDIVAVERCF